MIWPMALYYYRVATVGFLFILKEIVIFIKEIVFLLLDINTVGCAVVANAYMAELLDGNQLLSCHSVKLYVQDIIRGFFWQSGLQWPLPSFSRHSQILFLQDIGDCVVLLSSSYRKLYRYHYIFKWDITSEYPSTFWPTYFYENIIETGNNIFMLNNYVGSFYYFLALVSELCTDFTLNGLSELIYPVIDAVEVVLHHHNGQFLLGYQHVHQQAVLLKRTNHVMGPHNST